MLSTLLIATAAHAGGGPANVLVVVNGRDPSALDVAEHYAESRALPQGHVCTIEGVDPVSDSIALEDYRLNILGGLNGCLASHPQQEELDYLVLVRGLPYRVTLPSGSSVSLSAILQVSNTTKVTTGESLAGWPISTWGGTRRASIENPWYVGHSETDAFELENPYMSNYTTSVTIASRDTQPRAPRRQSAPLSHLWEYTDNLFVVSRLDGFDYADALDLIDRGVAADGTFPEAPITCMAAADSARGARDPECAYATDLLQRAGIPAHYIDTHDANLSDVTLAGLMTGTTSFADGIEGNEWIPGAFAGNLTSFGAVPGNFRCDGDDLCPGSESQTSIARFIRGGATFAHGTASEPLNNCFPGAGLFLLSTMGYSIIESALMTQRFLYWQNVYLGDPLSAPWAERPVVSIADTVPVNQPVPITATHTNGIAEVRLYADGIRVDEDASLSDSLDLEEGDRVTLLAVAVAENARVSREGWAEPDPMPRPDIQGWATTDVVLDSPVVEPPDEPSDDTGPMTDFTPPSPSKESGSGCTTAGSSAVPWWWFTILVCTRRRALPVLRTPCSTSEQTQTKQQPPA